LPETDISTTEHPLTRLQITSSTSALPPEQGNPLDDGLPGG
jgi:hypothetical protein